MPIIYYPSGFLNIDRIFTKLPIEHGKGSLLPREEAIAQEHMPKIDWVNGKKVKTWPENIKKTKGDKGERTHR